MTSHPENVYSQQQIQKLTSSRFIDFIPILSLNYSHKSNSIKFTVDCSSGQSVINTFDGRRQSVDRYRNMEQSPGKVPCKQKQATFVCSHPRPAVHEGTGLITFYTRKAESTCDLMEGWSPVPAVVLFVSPEERQWTADTCPSLSPTGPTVGFRPVDEVQDNTVDVLQKS